MSSFHAVSTGWVCEKPEAGHFPLEQTSLGPSTLLFPLSGEELSHPGSSLSQKGHWTAGWADPGEMGVDQAVGSAGNCVSWFDHNQVLIADTSVTKPVSAPRLGTLRRIKSRLCPGEASTHRRGQTRKTGHCNGRSGGARRGCGLPGECGQGRLPREGASAQEVVFSRQKGLCVQRPTGMHVLGSLRGGQCCRQAGLPGTREQEEGRRVKAEGPEVPTPPTSSPVPLAQSLALGGISQIVSSAGLHSAAHSNHLQSPQNLPVSGLHQNF